MVQGRGYRCHRKDEGWCKVGAIGVTEKVKDGAGLGTGVTEKVKDGAGLGQGVAEKVFLNF